MKQSPASHKMIVQADQEKKNVSELDNAVSVQAVRRRKRDHTRHGD